jgi:FixJ family two-component response regulator
LEAAVANRPIIAIVDDDPSVREGAMDLLHSMGFVAETFASPDAFLNSGQVDGIACLLTDMRMPGMSGLDLHDHLAASGRDIPTILVTAFPNPVDRARAMRAGVRCYLPKPFDADDLIACLGAALQSRGARGHA